MTTAQHTADRIRATRTGVDVTAPHLAHTFGDLVDLVARFQPDDTWTIALDPRTTVRAVLRWDLATITLRDPGDLDLARYVVAERQRARAALRRTVIDTVVALGLPIGPHRIAATRPVNAGLTRCPGCGANVTARTHRPGSPDCHDARRDRDTSRTE